MLVQRKQVTGEPNEPIWAVAELEGWEIAELVPNFLLCHKKKQASSQGCGYSSTRSADSAGRKLELQAEIGIWRLVHAEKPAKGSLGHGPELVLKMGVPEHEGMMWN